MPTLPASIESRFAFLSKAPDDRALVEGLLGNRSDLAHFVMQAAEDETWTSEHSEFYQLALNHLTQAFFIGRLDLSLAIKLVKIFNRHYPVLKGLIPKPLKLINGTQVVETNPLFLGVKSADFLQKIRSGKAVKEIEITVGPYDPAAVEWVVDYCETGEAEGFFRLDDSELAERLKIVEDWQIEGVREEIEKNRVKFIEPEKAEESLIDAYRRGRLRLAQGAIELLNLKRRGERLYLDEENRLGFEFTHIGDTSLRSFKKLKGNLGVIHGKGETVLHEGFWKLLHEAPYLSALDLSESDAFSPFLWGIPQSVVELDCSRTLWMKDALLSEIAAHLKDLEVLKLQNLSELTYAGFSSFHFFKNLKLLDLAHCHGLTDREIEMIRRLQPGIKIQGLKE